MLTRLVAVVLLTAPVRAYGQDPDVAEERTEILARDPSGLPRAEPERWRAWTPDAEVPSELRPLLVEAGRTYSRREFVATLETLYSALEVLPEYPPALHQLGVVYFRLRRYGDAIVAFERLLAVAPGEIGRSRALAHCYYSLGEYDRALAHYGKVLEKNPDEVEALRGYALSHMRLDQAERALELLERVLVLRPGHADAATWKAQVLYDLDRIEEAHAAVVAARDLDPYAPRAWYLLFKVLYELERDEEAEVSMERFRLLDRVTQELRVLEGQLLFDPGRLEYLSRMIDLHRAIENRAKVRETLARMIAVDPKDPSLRIYVLDVLQDQGDMQAASVAAEAMGEACPDSPEVWKRLETFYSVTRDRMKQVQAGERYRRLKGE